MPQNFFTKKRVLNILLIGAALFLYIAAILWVAPGLEVLGEVSATQQSTLVEPQELQSESSFVSPFFILEAFVALIAFFLLYRSERFFTFEYAFFLRAPLAIALIMIFLPQITIGPLAGISRNWFSLDKTGLFIVTWLAIFLAWVVMYTFWLLFLRVAPQNELAFSREEQKVQKSGNSFHNTLPEWTKKEKWGFPIRLFVFALLAVPIVGFSFYFSPEEFWEKLMAMASGIVVAFACWWIVIHGYHYIQWKWERFTEKGFGHQLEESIHHLEESIHQVEEKIIQKGEKVAERFLTKERLASLHRTQGPKEDKLFTQRRARTFFCLTTVLYFLGYFLLAPNQNLNQKFPALGYVLVLLMLLGWILPRLTLYFDKFRIPTMFIIIGVPMFLYTFFQEDYYYQLHWKKLSENEFVCKKEDLITPVAAYNAWSKKHPKENYPTMVVVTAGGGGIKAARWSTLVLTELVQELKQKFGESIFLISATSGGAVGSMYFVDHYDGKDLDIQKDKLEKIVKAASDSSLGAVGWGMVYPDFWRVLLGFPGLMSPIYDRAWAQEQRWASHLTSPGARVRRDWGKGIKEGVQPILVFNATLSETGEPLRIAPINFGDSFLPHKSDSSSKPNKALGEPHARNLFKMYPGADISLVSAARLSAAFPYVTPIARPKFPENFPKECEGAGPVHVADGAYYDNFGVVTAIEVLDKILPHATHRRILFVEIRASDSSQEKDADNGTDIGDEIARPLVTMLNARHSGQIVRNNSYLQIFRKRWESKGIEILNVNFELNITSPLSWHLTPAEKNEISKYWDSEEKEIKQARCQATKFFNEKTGSQETRDWCKRLE